MDACQFYGGENDGLMTGYLHPAAAPPPLKSGSYTAQHLPPVGITGKDFLGVLSCLLVFDFKFSV